MVLSTNPSLFAELFNYFPSDFAGLFTFCCFPLTLFTVTGQTACKKPGIRNEWLLQFIGQIQAELLSEELEETYYRNVAVFHWSPLGPISPSLSLS